MKGVPNVKPINGVYAGMLSHSMTNTTLEVHICVYNTNTRVGINSPRGTLIYKNIQHLQSPTSPISNISNLQHLQSPTSPIHLINKALTETSSRTSTHLHQSDEPNLIKVQQSNDIKCFKFI